MRWWTFGSRCPEPFGSCPPPGRAIGIQETLHHLLRHAGAVVRNFDEDVSSVPEGPDGDFPVSVGIGHAVIDGVFQNGLDDELDGAEALHAVLRRNGGGEFVFIAHFLDGEVVAGMLQLVPDGDDVAAPAQGDPEQAGQEVSITTASSVRPFSVIQMTLSRVLYRKWG